MVQEWFDLLAMKSNFFGSRLYWMFDFPFVFIDVLGDKTYPMLVI